MTRISHSSSSSSPPPLLHTSADGKSFVFSSRPSDVHSTNHPTDRPTAGPCLSSLRPVSPTQASYTRCYTLEQRRYWGSRYLQRAAAADQRALLARRNVKRLMRSSNRLTLSRTQLIVRSVDPMKGVGGISRCGRATPPGFSLQIYTSDRFAVGGSRPTRLPAIIICGLYSRPINDKLAGLK